MSAPKKKTEATPGQKKAADPALSVWVSANAGSGKTHVLVERVIRLLLAGARPDAILCITYTKAAAAEMAKRLFDKLSSWTAMSDVELAATLNGMGADGHDAGVLSRARKLFTMALETPGGLKIQTIHAFCERLLHLFPVEAGIAPGFRVMDDRDADEIQANATRHVLQQAESGAQAELAESFARLAERLSAEQFDELIGACVEALRKGSGEKAGLKREHYEMALKHALGILASPSRAVLRQQIIAIDRAAYQAHAEALSSFGAHFGINVSSTLRKIAALDDPYEEMRDYLLVKDSETGFKPRAETRIMSSAAAQQCPQAFAFIQAEQQRFLDLLRQMNTLEIIEASADAMILAAAILQRIENEKRETGRYDFADLIARASRLLSSRRQTQWVLFKLDPGLAHILLDESQDTGPDQWVMIHALAREFFSGEGAAQGPRTLFVVGDHKQSIYSFQGADVAAYDIAYRELVQPQRLVEVGLSISYRSTRQVLEAVDAVFPGNIHEPSRKGEPGLVTLWPMIEPEDKADDEPWINPLDRQPKSSPARRLAEKIAQEIAGWLNPDRPRQLTGHEAGRPVRPGDILILFRKRNAVFRMVLAELRRLGVPVAGADRLNLLRSLIVQDLQMLLSWILLPEDDHALAVILKSPLVPEPLNEEQLFDLAYDRKDTPLYERLAGRNREWLEQLCAVASTETPFALLSRVLNKMRPSIRLRLGAEAIEASDAMLDMALDHERENGPSLFGFLRWFASTETTIRRELDSAAGEVRLMTVHGAKGLEARVVIIADAAASASAARNGQNVLVAPDDAVLPGLAVWLPSGLKPYHAELERWVDKDEARLKAESDRLLYVAMTRAADELHVFAQPPTSKDPNWWDALVQGLGEPKDGKPVWLGPEPVTLASKRDGIVSVPLIPAWMIKAAFGEQGVKPVAVTTAMVGAKDYDPAAARRGRAIHRLLEEMADVPADERMGFALRRAARLGIGESEAASLARAMASPRMSPYLSEMSRGEVDISGELPDGREVSGRIDRLTITPVGIWLLDYKTDRYVPESLPQTHDYARQMAGYVALLQAAYPDLPITAAIFWTGKARLDILPALHTRDSAHT